MKRRQESNKAIRQTNLSPFFREENCINLLYLVVVWVLCNTTKRFVFWSLAAAFASGFSWFVTEHSFASSKAPFLCCKFLSAARQSKAWGMLWNWIVSEVLICTKIRWLSAIRESHKATPSLEISKVWKLKCWNWYWPLRHTECRCKINFGSDDAVRSKLSC